MSRWFRHYAGMMRDDKLVRVAIRSGQPIERVVWIWGAVLESAAEVDDNGKYDLDAPEVAYFLRADLSDVESVLDALEASGHVHGSCVVKWSNRQFSSDSSAERQRRHRDKKRAEEKPVDCEGQALGDAEVTSLSRHGDAPETELETEELEAKASCASGDALKPEHVVSVWNEQIAPALGKPKVRLLTPERRVRLKARIAGFTVAEFREVIANIMASPFLRGDTGWHGFSFDWFTKKANFLKVLEGNYSG